MVKQVKILKNKRRSVVEFKYDQAILDLIKPIQKKYWNNISKTWTIPNEALEGFKKKLEKNSISYDFKEFKPHAYIVEKDETIEFSFNTYIDHIDMLNEIDVSYDVDNKKWTCDKKYLDQLIQI